MRAILLAAGLGTRLRPITDTIPKCLVPINGKPLLGYWLDALVHLGIRSILINLHHHAEQVIDFARERRDTHLITWSYEKRLLGTGGTVRANQEFCGNEKVMIIHSDNYCRSTLKQFVAAHDQRPTGTDISMMTFVTPNPRSCGIVELDEYNVVNRLFEKVPTPPSNLANGAVYIFEPLVIQSIARMTSDPLDISRDVLPKYLGKIFAWPADGIHIDIGTPSELSRAHEHVKLV